MPKLNPIEASFKLIAVGGIFTTWAKLTIEAFNFAWLIVSTSQETYKPCVKLVCQRCVAFFEDDEEEHVITGSLLCEFCRLKK